MPSEEEILHHYTDFIGRDHDVWFFSFGIKSPDREQEIFRALLLGLEDVKENNDVKVKNRNFTVWAGIFYDDYLVAVPNHVSPSVSNILRERLSKVDDFDSMEGGSLASTTIMPTFRYEHGKIIEYFEDEMAGQTRVDDEEWYGTELIIHYRARKDVMWNNGQESYGGLHKSE